MMFSVIVLFLFHWDSTGLAAASIDVLAFREQIIPALAIDRVCCSYNHNEKIHVSKKELVFTYFSLFLHENIHCGYSLEAPCRGTSYEYPQHIFSYRNKYQYFLAEK